MKPLLDQISDELRAELERLASIRRFDDGQLIFAAFEDAAFLPIVVSGKVKMLHVFENGKEVIIGIFGDGEMFAVPPVFDGAPYPASAYAMETTKLMLLRREDFLALLRKSDEFALAVIGWTCDMLRDKTATIQNLATASPDQRVANVLLKLSEKDGNGGPVKINVRRQDIAEMAGLTTETTIRVTKRLSERGLISIVRGKIIIEEADRLRDFLGQ